MTASCDGSDEQRTERTLFVDALHGLAQEARHGELADLRRE
jgi:hypothetical protein